MIDPPLEPSSKRQEPPQERRNKVVRLGTADCTEFRWLVEYRPAEGIVVRRPRKRWRIVLSLAEVLDCALTCGHSLSTPLKPGGFLPEEP
jgi:hypothetical protein